MTSQKFPAVEVGKNGAASFTGPDGVDMFRMIALKSALGLVKLGITPTRGFTKKFGLAEASKYTGRKYKQSQLDLAIEDMQKAIDARKAVLIEAGEVVRRD